MHIHEERLLAHWMDKKKTEIEILETLIDGEKWWSFSFKSQAMVDFTFGSTVERIENE